ncbi:coiled-coil domain-containing protein 166 [Heptranchias perlo]|uniref:coiled-coil domain-containing protein 166 n=1 Tax=Heptranchias perlo TaxID=212740 RepID=UPI003559BA93
MSKKKKGRAEGKGKVAGMELEVLTAASERIVMLQSEYDEIVNELKQLKLKIYHLRQENEFLEREAQQTRLETQEYIVQMAKRTEKRQNQIITLSDQNHKNMEEIRKAKEKILTEFETQKQELEITQIEKETELVQINKEIEGLEEYKVLRQQQLARISELDKEVMTARAKHSHSLHSIKLNFIKEKADYKQNAKKMVKLLEKEANREAVCCLIEHIESIKVENQQLREMLVCLIRRSRVLREQQLELTEQHTQLLREREYCTKLRKLRYKKQLNEYVEPDEEEPKVEVQPEIEEVQPEIEGVQPEIEEVQPEIEEVQPEIEEVQPEDEEPEDEEPEDEEPEDG